MNRKNINPNKYSKIDKSPISIKTGIAVTLFIATLYGAFGSIAFTAYSISKIISNSKSPDIPLDGLPGKNGTNGLSGYYNGTVIQQIQDNAASILDEIESFDFCLSVQSDATEAILINLEGAINSSGIREIDVFQMVEDALQLQELVRNNTFCTIEEAQAIQNFVVTYAPLVNNGTGGSVDLENRTNNLNAVLTNNTFVKKPIVDSSIENDTLTTSIINGLAANSVVITDSTRRLTTSTQLSTNRGGTNANSSNWSGFVRSSSTTWSLIPKLNHTQLRLNGSLLDSHFQVIGGSKIFVASGVRLVVNNATGYLSSSQYLTQSLGGFNGNLAGVNGYEYWFDGAIDVIGTITRTGGIAPTNPGYVIINDASGYMTEEAYLDPIRGGTGQNSSAWNGYVRIVNGVWSSTATAVLNLNDLQISGTINNTFFATNASIDRSKLEAGIANHVLVNDGTGVMSSEAQLSASRGGTGIDTSSSTGFLQVNSGVWSVKQLNYSDVPISSLNNSEISSSANISRSKFNVDSGRQNYVIVNNFIGNFNAEQRLATSRGGTNADTTLFSNNVLFRVTSGTWSGVSSLPYSNLNLTNSIVNTDISVSAAIARSKIATGTANHVVINDVTGALSSEAQLSPSRGGIGVSTTGVTGFPSVVAGIWSFANSYVAVTSYSPLLTFGNLATGIIQLITRGRYVRFGQSAYIEIYIILSSKGTAVGQAQVTLPITVGGSGQNIAGVSVLQNNIDLPTNYYKVMLLPNDGANSAFISAVGDNNLRINLSNTHFTSSSSLQISLYVQAQ